MGWYKGISSKYKPQKWKSENLKQKDCSSNFTVIIAQRAVVEATCYKAMKWIQWWVPSGSAQ